MQTTKLGSWTDFGGDATKKFSGSAEYRLTFSKPAGGAYGWLLDLGKVAESARVELNGKALGTLIGPTFQVLIPDEILKATNALLITVSNGMANRIADLDQRKVDWKKFYNINMSPRLRENRGADGNFTAEKWAPQESGLIGPVTLMTVRQRFLMKSQNGK